LNYGLEIAASGVLVNMHRTDVLANNLANMDTVGFKPDWAGSLARDPVRQEDGVLGLPSNRLLERLGAGVLASPTKTSFAQGPITETGRDLDLAIRGDGFFVVGGEGGPSSLRLTRDGRFSRDPQGRLVAIASGLPVLNERGRPVVLAGGGRVQIGPDGTLTRDGEAVARLWIGRVADPGRLTKAGANLFASPAQTPEVATADQASIVQGSLEGSGVDEIRTMLDLTASAQAISASLGMVQYNDRLMDRAVNTLGRVT
jgi:flagellar basal body rod protein FlgG